MGRWSSIRAMSQSTPTPVGEDRAAPASPRWGALGHGVARYVRANPVAVAFALVVTAAAASTGALWNADASAKIGGVIWLGIGALVLLYYVRKGTGVLSEHAADPFTVAESDGALATEERA